MIDPILEIANALYTSANDMPVTPSFWIYSIRELEDFEQNGTQIYDRPSHSQINNNLEMTDDIFAELWNSLLVTDLSAVKNITDVQTDVEYWGYSQAIPADITDKSEAKFAIFFMLPVMQTQAFNIQQSEAIDRSDIFMVLIVFALLCLVMLSVYCIIIMYSFRIIAPVKKLQTYTNKMSQARDLDAKQYVV